MTNEQFEKLRRYLDDDAQMHIKAHGKWGLDAGKLHAAMESAGVVFCEPPFIERAILGLISTIEATGGVRLRDDGLHGPLADEDWIDLGEAYVDACAAIGRTPVVEVDEFDDEEDDDASTNQQ